MARSFVGITACCRAVVELIVAQLVTKFLAFLLPCSRNPANGPFIFNPVGRLTKYFSFSSVFQMVLFHVVSLPEFSGHSLFPVVVPLITVKLVHAFSSFAGVAPDIILGLG
jgi:hypothetical protein